jgi:hypothetical protein
MSDYAGEATVLLTNTRSSSGLNTKEAQHITIRPYVLTCAVRLNCERAQPYQR